MEHICKNCGTAHDGTYCYNCGQKVLIKRFTTRFLISESVSATFNLDRGILFTMYSLLIRPHKVISEYISGATRKYTNPAKFAVYLIAFATLIMIQRNIVEKNLNDYNSLTGIENDAKQMHMQQLIIGIVKNNLQYLHLFFIPFFALVSRWLFRKYNYAEHLILHSYIYGLITLLTTVLMIFLSRFSVSTIGVFIFSITFYTIAFKKLFKNSLLLTLIKSTVVYFLAYFFILLIIGSSAIIYLIILKSKGLL